VEASFTQLPPEAQIMATFNRLPSEAVEALVAALQESSPLYTKTLAAFGKDAARGIGDELLTHLVKGKNPVAAARAMHKAWGTPLTRALTISRTEMLRAYRGASLASYRANAHIVKSWIWFANLDESTCMSCVALHGTEFPLTESMDDHPNGRCCPVLKTVTMKELGLEGLPETGLDISPGDGVEWFKKLPEAQQRDMMKAGKYEAWKAGKFELSQLSRATVHPDWGRMFSETPLRELVATVGR